MTTEPVTGKIQPCTDEDDAYLWLMDACLKNYMTIESKKHLLDAFAMARTLWFIYESLAQYRLRIACDKVRFMSFQRHGKLRDSLKEFMTACIAMTVVLMTYPRKCC